MNFHPMQEQQGQAHTKQAEISQILRDLATTPGANNEPVLAIYQQEQIVAKNGGYPRHMYHETLEPIVVVNRAQEAAVAAKGYVRNYIRHEFPKTLFRRNADAKFESADFVETRTVRDKAHEEELKKAKAPRGAGAWLEHASDLEPLAEGPSEDASVTIARLEGMLAEARAASETKRK